MKFEKIVGVDIKTAQDFITNVVEIYSESPEEIKTITLKAITETSLDFNYLHKMIKVSGNLFKSLNLTYADTIRILGKLSNAGQTTNADIAARILLIVSKLFPKL